MKLIERMNDSLEGFIEVKYIQNGEVIKIQKQNLVLSQARQIIRDMLISPNAELRLNKLSIGDMNMTYGEDVNNLPPPVLSELALINELLTVTATSIAPTTINNRYALVLSFSISENELNDPNPSVMVKLITELGLKTNSGLLFSRVILPIIKTKNVGLSVSWTIII